MSLGNILLVVLVALTLYNNGVQSWIHFETYPLLANIGKAEFPSYLAEYEKRLTIPLLGPYAVTVLANLILVFVHPDNMSAAGVILALVLNLAVAATTQLVATPIYNRVKSAGTAAGEDMKQLMNINLIRLVISTVASLVVLGMLLSQLP